jgi:5'-nucleotidase
MRILVTNDDGINAPGLAVLESIAAALSDDVWVVAPEYEKSGAGHSLTLVEPLRVRQLAPRRFAVSGTPTDCVMLGVGVVIKDQRPDLLLSGVNRGANLAEDVTYSGTISAAMEGTLLGIPSLALSQAIANWPGDDDAFACALAHGTDVVQRVLKAGWPKDVLLNINFPPVAPEAVKGVRITEQGQRELGDMRIDTRTDARGFPYYWLGLGRFSEKPGHDSDLKAMRDAMISITPLHLDLTHQATRTALKAIFDEQH